MKTEKYSANFERDYSWYLKWKDEFNFCGTRNPSFSPIYEENGVTAKKAFYTIDSCGKNMPTKEPKLLEELLLCKASLNFQIKEWAYGRADGTLPLIELSKDEVYRKYNYSESEKTEIEKITIVEWVNNEQIFFRDYKELYNFPDWVITAIENQYLKIISPVKV